MFQTGLPKFHTFRLVRFLKSSSMKFYVFFKRTHEPLHRQQRSILKRGLLKDFADIYPDRRTTRLVFQIQKRAVVSYAQNLGSSQSLCSKIGRIGYFFYSSRHLCGVFADRIAVVVASMEKQPTTSRSWVLGESEFTFTKGQHDGMVVEGTMVRDNTEKAGQSLRRNVKLVKCHRKNQ